MLLHSWPYSVTVVFTFHVVLAIFQLYLEVFSCVMYMVKIFSLFFFFRFCEQNTENTYISCMRFMFLGESIQNLPQLVTKGLGSNPRTHSLCWIPSLRRMFSL